MRNTSPRLDKLLPWLLLAAGLAATFFLQQAAFNAARHFQRSSFDYQTHEITLRIEQRLAAYEQVLSGVKGLYVASKSVERDEFHDYVANLRLAEHFPGIQGVGFSLIIPPREKARHIETIRKEGFHSYTLYPEGERDLYTSIIYLEPFSGRNLRAFGYDMYSEAVRRAAMEQARDSGKSAISGKVRLVQETEQNVQAGFLMYLPVYRNGRPHDTLTERRTNIIGWVYAPFRMGDLMRGILGAQVNNVDLEIYDGSNSTPETLMYDSVSSQNQADAPLYSSVRRIEVIGQDWTIRLHSLPIFEAKIDTGRVTVIRLFGTVLSLLLSLLVWQLVSGRARALKLANGMTRELRESERHFRAVTESANDAIITAAGAGNIMGWNAAAERLFGYTEAEIIGQPITVLMPERFRNPHNAGMARVVAGETPHILSKTVEAIGLRKDGSEFPLELSLAQWQANEGKFFSAIIRDITERKQAEEQIRTLAFYDALTQLPNRRLLNDRLGQTMAASKRSGHYGALMFLDLDNFKPLNDMHGHGVGDLLLIEAAHRLTGCVREVDTVARFGGDEFVVMLGELDSDKAESAVQADIVAEKIRSTLAEPYLLRIQQGGKVETTVEHHCTASIGVVLFIDHEGSAEDILKWADMAMYQAKERGRNQVYFFDSKH